jgi:hypothetical protein
MIKPDELRRGQLQRGHQSRLTSIRVKKRVRGGEREELERAIIVRWVALWTRKSWDLDPLSKAA